MHSIIINNNGQAVHGTAGRRHHSDEVREDGDVRRQCAVRFERDSWADIRRVLHQDPGALHAAVPANTRQRAAIPTAVHEVDAEVSAAN